MNHDLPHRLADSDQVRARLDEIRGWGSRPVVVYGAGIYAREVTDFLGAHGVTVADYLVDEAYAGGSTLTGHPARTISDIRGRHKDFCVVIGFCGDPHVARTRLIQRHKMPEADIHELDCRFWRRFAMAEWSSASLHQRGFSEVLALLEDDTSRMTWVSYLNAKLLFDSGELRKYRAPRQYFPPDLPKFMPKADDVFVDAGAFTGDTLAEVVALTGGRGTAAYHAFEPDEGNADQLALYVSQRGLSNVTIRRVGLWHESSVLCFAGNEGSRSGFSDDGAASVRVEALDQLGIRPSFVKMDIEGAEHNALRGMEHTLRLCRPRLAVAVYHKPEDMLEIPRFLRQVASGYHFHLRIHSHFSEELVLYAWADASGDVK